MITENDVAILRTLATFYVLCRMQIQRICFPGHTSGRSTRKRLSKLLRAGLINKHTTLVPFQNEAAGCPCYYLSSRGAEFLASYFDDEAFLSVNTRRPRPDLLFHWLSIGNTHITLAEAIAKQEFVKVDAWVNEWEVINKQDTNERQFVLHTVLRRSPPLSCSPDAAFLLTVANFSKVFYLEQDRNTSGIRQVAASKSPGYAELAKRLGHRKHFPQTNVDAFRVLFITSGGKGRRDLVARAIKGKPGAELWLFAAQEDLTPDSFLFDPVFVDVNESAGPLVNRPESLKEQA